MKSTTASWRQTMPEFLLFLEDKLNHRIGLHMEELGFNIYIVDLSNWRLRFPSNSPIIVVNRNDLATQTPAEIAQSLQDVIRARKLTWITPIVLAQGDGTALRAWFRTTLSPLPILDENDQLAVLTSRRPTSVLLDRLSRQLPLTQLSPYETHSPVTGSRFFGRESYVRRILSSTETHFAIIGIRRIGKTSLLQEVEEQLRRQARDTGDPRADERILAWDCSTLRSSEEFMREVVRKLEPKELTRIGHRYFPLYFPDFIERMARRRGGPLIFLLDEFDALLSAQAHDTELPDTLRAASNRGRNARFIVAGFRQLLQEQYRQSSPFYNFAKPLELKELNRDETATMIIEPMRNLGIQFEHQSEIVDRIFEETAGQPNLLQFYCSLLIEQLDQTGKRTLSPDNLLDVNEHKSFRDFVVNTFIDNTRPLEKAIVFAVLAKYYPGRKKFDLEAIDTALAERSVHIGVQSLENACRNLTYAGTFMQQGQHYHFAAPAFPTILRENCNVEYWFRKMAQEGIG